MNLKKFFLDVIMSTITVGIFGFLGYRFIFYKEDHWTPENKPKTIGTFLGIYFGLIFIYTLFQFDDIMRWFSKRGKIFPIGSLEFIML